MRKHDDDEYIIDWKLKDRSGKKQDEGYMSIGKCIAHWKKIMKKKGI